MVELAPEFMMIASSRDTERLFSMLSYKTLSLSSIKDRHGVYAFVAKDENRDKPLRKPRPSIRAQLAEGKTKAAPKKATKTKNHDLEVSMKNFTVEETNLISIYNEGGKARLVENITAALPFMDEDMRELATRTAAKIDALTDAEFSELAAFAADEV